MSLFAVYRSDRSIGQHIDHLGRDCRACRSCHSASSLSLRLRPVRHTHGCDGICRRCVQHSVSLFSHSSHVLCLRHAFLEGDDIVFFVKPVKCQSLLHKSGSRHRHLAVGHCTIRQQLFDCKYFSCKVCSDVLNDVFILFIFNFYCLVNILQHCHNFSHCD